MTLVVKNPSAKARDARVMGSVPASGRPPGAGSVYPLKYPCLENPMGRETWWVTVHGVTKSQTGVSVSTPK